MKGESTMRRHGSTRFFKGSVLGVLLASVASGCGLGFLASAPWIRNADNNDVVVLGDSIWALSGEIQANLHAWNGGTFRNYAVSGAELIGGVIAPSVVQQYDIAMSDNPNSTILVMDGGGNDILLPAVAFDPYDCLTQWYEWGRLSSSCKNFIDDIYVDGVNFLNDVHADGFTDIVFLGYYYTKNGLLWVDDLKEAIDYGDARLAQACQYSAADCTFVDPRSTIRDRDITLDGVHPNSTGSRKLAELIWPVLQPKL
jgi:lysophospholipase L1-like esterase